jgi:hypothetical protein
MVSQPVPTVSGTIRLNAPIARSFWCTGWTAICVIHPAWILLNQVKLLHVNGVHEAMATETYCTLAVIRSQLLDTPLMLILY